MQAWTKQATHFCILLFLKHHLRIWVLFTYGTRFRLFPKRDLLPSSDFKLEYCFSGLVLNYHIFFVTQHICQLSQFFQTLNSHSWYRQTNPFSLSPFYLKTNFCYSYLYLNALNSLYPCVYSKGDHNSCLSVAMATLRALKWPTVATDLNSFL